MAEPITDAEIAELRAGLEGLPDGPWTASPWHIEEGNPAVRVREGWVFCTTPSDAWSAHVARCSPDKIAALLARLEAAERGWQDIATAPVDGTRILATGFNWNDESKGRWSEILSWEDGDWTTDNGESVYPPTHWMPLANFPVPAKAEG